MDLDKLNRVKMSFIGFRLSVKDRALLEKVCTARGEDISSFVRRCIKQEFAALGFYGPDVMKALGVKVEN